MRFLSSSAFASAPKLRLAASCSAAETMRPPLRVPMPECPALYKDQAASSPAGSLRARIWTVPPAFSTAATADFDAPKTASVTLALSSPPPRRRTPSLARRKTPAFTSAAASIVAARSRRAATSALCSRSRLTSVSLRANLTFLNPRFGRRRCSGIWPPSNPLIRTPERAVCPLPPRPPVFPTPEPIPRPMRFRVLRAPGRPASSCSFIVSFPLRPLLQGGGAHLFFHHADKVRDFRDHAARLGRVDEFRDTADFVQPQANQRLALAVMPAQRAAGLLDRDGLARFVFSGHRLLPSFNRPPARPLHRGVVPAVRRP